MSFIPTSPTQSAKHYGAAVYGHHSFCHIRPATKWRAGKSEFVIDHAMLRLGSAANPQVAAPNLLLFLGRNYFRSLDVELSCQSYKS